MGIRVQSYRYGGVAEEFLNEFRMNAAWQEQRSAGVPEVVETHVRKSGLLQERCEATVPEVRGIKMHYHEML